MKTPRIMQQPFLLPLVTIIQLSPCCIMLVGRSCGQLFLCLAWSFDPVSHLAPSRSKCWRDRKWEIWQKRSWLRIAVNVVIHSLHLPYVYLWFACVFVCESPLYFPWPRWLIFLGQVKLAHYFPLASSPSLQCCTTSWLSYQMILNDINAALLNVSA